MSFNVIKTFEITNQQTFCLIDGFAFKLSKLYIDTTIKGRSKEQNKIQKSAFIFVFIVALLEFIGSDLCVKRFSTVVTLGL